MRIRKYPAINIYAFGFNRPKRVTHSTGDVDPTHARATMQYEDIRPIDRDTLALWLRSNDEAEMCRALVAAALHDPDWRWVQSQCLAVAAHSSSSVRRVAAICFGHLARIHRQIDREQVEAVLDRLAVDPIQEVRGAVQDARDDFATFLDRDPPP